MSDGNLPHSSPSEDNTKQKRNFRRLRRGLVWAIGISVGIFVLGAVWVRLYLNPYLKARIIEAVQKGTNNRYQLEIKDLSVRLLQATIEMKEIHLKKNLTHRKPTEASAVPLPPMEADIRIASLQAQKINWIAYLQTGELQIDNIELQRPLIKCRNLPAWNPETSWGESFSQFIGTFSNQVHCKKINIHHADWHLEAKIPTGSFFHHGDSIQVAIRDWRVKVQKGFSFKEAVKIGSIEFFAKAYHCNTLDGVYEFSIHHFRLNTTDSLLKGRHFVMHPHSLLALNKPHNLKKYQGNRYDIRVAEAKAHGVNFFRMLNEQEFAWRSVHLDNLNLQIHSNIGLQAKTPTKDSIRAKIPIPKNLKAILRRLPVFIHLDTLAIRNAQFLFTQNLSSVNAPKSYHLADSVQLHFYNIALGKAIDRLAEKKVLYSQAVDFQMRNYEHKSFNDLYKLQIKQAQVSSLDSVIRVEEAKLIPLVTRNEFCKRTYFQDIYLDASAYRLQANGLDVERMVYQQEFVLGSLHLYQPNFSGFLDAGKPKRPAQRFQNFEQFLHSIPVYIQVDTLAIHQGKVRYTEQSAQGMAEHQAENIVLSVRQIDLGRALTSSALAQIDTKSLLFTLSHYTYTAASQAHRLTLDRVHIQSTQSLIQMQGAHWEALQNPTHSSQPSIDIKADTVQAYRIDFERLLLKQEIDWGYLRVYQPQIKIFSKKSAQSTPYPILTSAQVPASRPSVRKLLAEIPVFIKIDTFSVQNAHITYLYERTTHPSLAQHQAENINFVIPHITLGKAAQFEGDSVARLYSDNIFFTLQNYTFQDAQNRYRFTLENIESSVADSVLLVKKLRFRPISDKSDYEKAFPERASYLDWELYSLRAQAIDVARLAFEQELVMKSLVINQPLLRFYHRETSETKNDTKTTLAPGMKGLGDWLQEIPLFIRIDTLHLNKAQLYYENTRKTSAKDIISTQTIRQLDTQINQLTLGIQHQGLHHKPHSTYAAHSFRFQLEDYVWQIPESYYRVSIKKLFSDVLLDSAFYAEGLEVHSLPEEPTLDRLYTHPFMRWNVYVANLKAQLSDFQRWLSGERYTFACIRLDRIRLNMYRNSVSNTESPSLKNLLFSTNLPIQIDTLHLSHATWELRHKMTDLETQRHTADSLSASLFGINYQNKSFDIQGVLFKIKNYQTQSADHFYAIRAGRMALDSRTSSWEAEDLAVLPTLDDNRWAQLHQYQADRFNLKIRKIATRSLDWAHWLDWQEFKLRKLDLLGVDLDIFRDKRFAKDSEHLPKMPHQAIQRLPFPILIDSLHIDNSRVNYSEKVPRGQGRGAVEFTDLKADVYHLYTQGSPTDTTVIRAEARLMNKGILVSNLKIRLSDNKLLGYYDGVLGETEASFVNQMIESNAHLRVRKGVIDKIIFRANFQDSLATGKMDAGYKRLRIQILKPQKENKKRGLLTFLANLIIKNRNNLDRNRHKVGKIRYTRRKEDGFIAFLWRALASGLMDTLK